MVRDGSETNSSALRNAGFIYAFNDAYGQDNVFNDVTALQSNPQFMNGVINAVLLFNNEKIVDELKDSTSKMRSYGKEFSKIEATSDHLKDELSKLRKEAEENIKYLEKSLREDMLIKSTSEYWKIKSGNHRKRYHWIAISTGVYAIFSFFMILIGAIFLPKILSTDQSLMVGNISVPLLGFQQNSLQYYIIFVSLALLTLIFWLGRVLVRTMFSEQHLSTDAEEKKVFSETYLSLLRAGDASKEERILMLTSIFKSSSDGIVRDDNGADVGVAAIASQLLMPKQGLSR